MTSILVVDDQPNMPLLLRLTLESAAYEVVEAEGGMAALAVLERAEPDCLVLEVRMPGMDGWEVLGRMRSTGILERVAVVVVSAHASPSAARGALNEGSGAYLTKPFGRRELLATVEGCSPRLDPRPCLATAGGRSCRVSSLTPVRIGSLPLGRFQSILPAERYAAVAEAIERSRRVLADRVVWNINSTARGGGVAELLVSLLAYSHGVGVDTRWEVITGTNPFFLLTKRIHNNLHSFPGDGGPLGDDERAKYEATLAPSLAELVERVRPQDVVIVHDPQPAGLVPGLKEAIGVPVIWRCHVGIDVPSELARRAWRFLTPYVEPADAYVFSRRSFVWETLDDTKIELIAPVIDAFSPKNQMIDDATVRAILAVVGLARDGGIGAPAFTREDGSPGSVVRPAAIVEGRPLRDEDPIVLQVSRWDRLKDPLGVIRGFIDHVAPRSAAHLVYAGPAIEAVADDPEGAEVLREARQLYDGFSPEVRERVHLVCLPMDDVQENAAVVNALQRRADVVVQKSIAEGFGLTVAEAMWKARPVVATRIGGIQDQIVDGVSGVLLDDPYDLEAYGAAVLDLLQDPGRARGLGKEAQHRVRDQFLAVRSLIQYLDLIERLVV